MKGLNLAALEYPFIFNWTPTKDALVHKEALDVHEIQKISEVAISF